MGAARLAALAAAMVVVGCLGETSAPRGPQRAAFAILPSFPSHAAAAVPFNRVRITLSRSASTALDTTIAFPAGADSLVVKLTTEIFGTSETMALSLAMIDAANDTVFRGGPLAVTLTATSSQPAALPIPLRYVGVGANAKTVRITPKTTSVLFRDSVTLAATAYDSGGLPIPGTPVSWRSLDTNLAKVPTDTLGRVLVGIVRGVARVEALLPTNIADTAQVTVQPVAVAIGLFSGGGQTGGVGAPLGQPMVVRVKAADSIGVAGVPVGFTVVSGGGVVSKATDTTNANGDASTVWTLGGTLGVQTLKATVAAAPTIATTMVASGIVGAAKKLSFTVQPPAGLVGGALAPPVQVVAQDSFGNTVTAFTGNVTVALGANPGGATLNGTLTVAAVAGVATFANLSLSAPATGYTLVASATGLASATSAAFAVSAVNLNAWINAAGGNWSVATNWSKGTVPVATDSVTIKQPGTYTVTLDVNATVARLDVGAASGTQTLAVPAHTLSTLGGTFATNTVLALSGTGTITGAGSNTVAGAFNWTGGNLGGASGAGGAIRVLSGGTLSIAPVAQDSFQNYTLELAGTGTWTGTDTVNTGNGAVLRIASGGSLTIPGSPTLIWSLGGAAPAVNVVGTLTASSPAGTFASLLLPVNDSGTVNATSGLLILAVGGTSTGAFTVATNAFLLLGGGTHTLTASSSVTGTGSVQVFNGTVNTAGTWNMSSNTMVAGGTLNFNAATAFTNNLGLTSGAVGGSGLVTVGFTLVWKGGAFGPGGGTVKLNAGATDTIAPAAAVQLTGYTLELAGNGVWSTSQTIAMGSGAVLRVDAGATQTITADPTIDASLGGAAPLLDLQGTLVRTTSANNVTVSVPFNLAGTLNIQSGGVNVTAGGTMAGTVTEGVNDTLRFVGGTTTLANRFKVTGSSGGTQIVGGTVGGLAATDTATFDNLTLAGGGVSLAGGTIQTVFEMIWSGPAVVSGGTLFVPATSGLTMGFTTGTPSLQNAKLIIAGSGGWPATTPLSSGSGDTIRVLAGGNLSFSGAGGGFLYNQGGAASVFDNRGTVISATPSGTAFTISAAYTEQGGTLAVTSGRLRLSGGSTPPFLGTATVNAGDTLELAGGAFQMNGPLTIGGGGTLLVSAGTLAPNGVGLGLTGNFATTGTGALVMNNPFDSLEISGNATFGGAAGTLSNGVIRIGGNFTQTGSANFAPGPNTSPQRVVLTGSGPQTISFADPVSSFFRRLQSNQGANGAITLTGVTRAGWFQWIGNNAMVGTNGDFIADTITGAATGSNITVNKVELSTLLNTSGFFGPDTAVFTGTNQVIPSLYGYHSIRVAQSTGTATFSGNPAALANLVVSSGTLDLTGRQVGVTGFFQTSGTGALRMTGATDSLGVGGTATFGGGSTTGLLTAGLIDLKGSFAQSGTVSSFTPSTAQRTRFSNGAGALQTVSFASPTQSFFDSLVVDRGVGARGTVQLLTDVRVNRGMTIANGSDITGATARATIIGGTLSAQQSTLSPTMTNLAIELQTAPLIGPSVVLVSPDTMVYDGTISTVPTSTGLVYKNARINTSGAIQSPGGITYHGDLIVSSGTYTIGSNVDSVAGFLRTEGTGALSMVAIVAAPTVAVRDSAVFAGGPSTALSGGVLRVWGNFVQRGTGGQFAPTGTRVSFQRAAAGAQTIQFADSSGSFFRDVVLNGTVADTIRLLSNAQVQDSAVMTGTSVLVSNAAEALKLPATGILRVHSQAVLKPFRAEAGTWVLDSTFIGGTAVRFSPDTAVLLNGSNFYGTGTIGVAGISSTPSPLFAWKSVRMTGGTLPSNGTTYAGSLIIQGGTYTENTFGVTDSIAGFLRTEGTGTFLMPIGTAAPIVAVHDSAVFAGGADTLAAGTLRLYGSFVQRGASTSFVGGASHTTQFAGSTRQSITFASPGTAASTFGNLLLNRTSGAVSQVTSVSLGSPIFVNGVLQDTSAAVADTIAGNGNTVTAGGFNLNDTYISNAPVVVPSGSLTLTGNVVTFANMSPTAVQLAFTRGVGVTLNAFAFLTVPTGAGKYFSVTSTALAGPATFNFSNPVQPTTAPTSTQYTKSGLLTLLWGSFTL